MLLCTDIFPAKKCMAIPSEKTFYNQQKGPKVIDEDMFRFEMFVLLLEEWLRRKLKVRLIVECLR
jgi:putative transposase